MDKPTASDLIDSIIEFATDMRNSDVLVADDSPIYNLLLEADNALYKADDLYEIAGM